MFSIFNIALPQQITYNVVVYNHFLNIAEFSSPYRIELSQPTNAKYQMYAPNFLTITLELINNIFQYKTYVGVLILFE